MSKDAKRTTSYAHEKYEKYGRSFQSATIVLAAMWKKIIKQEGY
jgi:hypothetical protein